MIAACNGPLDTLREGDIPAAPTMAGRREARGETVLPAGQVGTADGATRQDPAISVRWSEQLDIPAHPEFVACVRRHLMDLIQYAGFSSTEAVDVAVAVSEALSNAIEHSHSSGLDPLVSVHCNLNPEGLHVTIRDQGKAPWDPAAVPEEADPLDDLEAVSHRGRGLDFMRALTDGLAINVTDSGTEVKLFKRRSAHQE